MKKSSVGYKHYIFSAMFAALILMGTMFIQVPSVNGYVHIGDSFIYLAAAFLPLPFSIFAAGLGAGLADILSGYVIYAPFTFVIKGLMAAFFSSKGEKLFNTRNAVAMFIAGCINILGYYIVEVIMFPQGAFSATLVNSLHTVPGNAVQSVTASIIFVITAFAFDKINLKKTLDKIV